MPRVPRRAKRRSSAFTEDQKRQLLTGHELVADSAFGAGDSFDEVGAKAAWDILGARLLADWIAEKPGTRPWAWWRWQSPERRRRIDGGIHPHDNAERSKHVAQLDNQAGWKRAFALHFGLPSMFIPEFDQDLYDDFWRNGLHGKDSEIFESEAVYLRRLNLLTDAENTELFS